MKSHNNYFPSRKEENKIKMMGGLETTILTGLNGEKMMMALTTNLPGYSVPEHSHYHEQVGVVLSGKILLRIGDEERIISKGDFFSVPSNTPHSVTCLDDEPFMILDIFHPAREEFINKLNETKS